MSRFRAALEKSKKLPRRARHDVLYTHEPVALTAGEPYLQTVAVESASVTHEVCPRGSFKTSMRRRALGRVFALTARLPPTASRSLPSRRSLHIGNHPPLAAVAAIWPSTARRELVTAAAADAAASSTDESSTEDAQDWRSELAAFEKMVRLGFVRVDTDVLPRKVYYPSFGKPGAGLGWCGGLVSNRLSLRSALSKDES